MSDKPVVLVVPPIAGGRLDNSEIQKRLARGDESVASREESLLTCVLRELGVGGPVEGLAALRYLGDTGEAAGTFVCAADPVHFQTRMRDLVVQRLGQGDVTHEEVAAITATLQDELGSADGTKFVAASRRGYLLKPEPMDTATVAPRSAAGTVADRFMPSGPSAREYQQLQSEVQMVLHDHAVNLKRDELGQPRISALWLWGGGSLPAPEKQTLPRLTGTHSLLTGYWMHQGAQVSKRTDSSLKMICQDAAGAVIDLTASTQDELVANLDEASRLLSRGRFRKLSIVSQDGICIRLGRWHRWRFWKSGSGIMEKTHADD